jgi:hypothetical protein
MMNFVLKLIYKHLGILSSALLSLAILITALYFLDFRILSSISSLDESDRLNSVISCFNNSPF